MTAENDLERRLADFYATEAPRRAPDWVLTSTLATVDTTRQRRAAIALPWRLPHMNTYAKAGVAIVAVIAVVAVGLAFFRAGSPSGVGAVQAPSAAPTILPTLRDVERFDAWLYRLVVRASADVGRHRRRSSAQITVLTREPSEPDRASELADRDQLERGLRRLNDAQRTILILHFYVGMSHGEAADALAIPVGTAKSRLHYAIEALRAAIHAEERTPVGALREGRTA